jgi:hypothetical protein
MSSYKYRLYGTDERSALTHYSIYLWISKQLNSLYCIQLIVDIEALSEKNDEFISTFINVLFAFAVLNHSEEDNTYSWKMKADFSNGYLQRLSKRLKSSTEILQLKISPSRLSDLNMSIKESLTFRTNLKGEQEHLGTYVSNQLSCPLL